MNKIRIIIADDHAVLRSGLKALLSYTPQFDVIGEAGDGMTAIKMVEEVHPDVLILDLSMPGMNGVECIKELRSRGLSCRILVLTMYDDEEYIKEVMRAGADGYVLKKSADTELIEGIIKIYSGKKYLNETISQTLINSLLKTSTNEPEGANPYKLLSIREREVLRFLAKGYTNSEIAEMLSLSPKTIDTYRSRIMSKLNVRKKSELVNYAMQHKLIHT
ncbi:response regulator transcription factor|uniref:Two component transcriptional regulator, LuxR family n=1 Tax=Dendrosporobacter quercicolus TaxID=146817 RepID=A0A1G9MVV2_9FIRM|nr:response regulator transcription factor [Dendrosporobacter quercicolus]NSL47155.1 response regulator transcription factor [Dendrosporobacter quercicolus DSM 1736]SDL78349.1 two component transcriptional regulator, LuxR family [Dendrosporobacter quercicolus]